MQNQNAKLDMKRLDLPTIVRRQVSCTGHSLYRALPWMNAELLCDTWKEVRLEVNRECGTRMRGMRPEDQAIVHQRLGIDCCLEKTELVRYDLMENKFVKVGPRMTIRDLCKLPGTYVVGAKYPWHSTCIHNGRVYDHFWGEAQAMDKTITEYYRVIESKVPEAQARHDEIYMAGVRAAEARKEKLRAERSARMKARIAKQREQAARPDYAREAIEVMDAENAELGIPPYDHEAVELVCND